MCSFVSNMLDLEYDEVVEVLESLKENISWTRFAVVKADISRPFQPVMLQARRDYPFQDLLQWNDIYTLLLSNRELDLPTKKSLIERFPTLFRPVWLNSTDLSGRTIARQISDLYYLNHGLIEILKYLASQGANLHASTDAGSLLHVGRFGVLSEFAISLCVDALLLPYVAYCLAICWVLD